MAGYMKKRQTKRTRQTRTYKIRLINGEERNRQYPHTFHIDSRAAREAIRTGDIVKVGFETDDPSLACRGERMWVIVRECMDGEVFLGTLDNYPVCLPLKYGCWVRFGPEHILDIEDSCHNEPVP